MTIGAKESSLQCSQCSLVWKGYLELFSFSALFYLLPPHTIVQILDTKESDFTFILPNSKKTFQYNTVILDIVLPSFSTIRIRSNIRHIRRPPLHHTLVRIPRTLYLPTLYITISLFSDPSIGGYIRILHIYRHITTLQVNS